MNVFDFDNTLYRGESSIDFALYMIRINKKIILWLPKLFWNLLKYKLCLVNKRYMEKSINDAMKRFIRSEQEVLSLTDGFWKTHISKLDRSMLKRIHKDDIIITAGPSFLLNGIKKHLRTSNMICSEVDLENKCVVYLNFSDNKVRRYREKHGDKPIDCFYTDSFNDKAMMDISRNVFIVKKGKVRRIK